MNEETAKLKKEIAQIRERNERVEADKAWETGIIRKGAIAATTYILIGLYMTFLGIEVPWLNALVPTAGYFFSTLTLSWVKQLWLKDRLRKYEYNK